ncbi:MAG: hypothetical protein ABH879_03640 [archaeon]
MNFRRTIRKIGENRYNTKKPNSVSDLVYPGTERIPYREYMAYKINEGGHDLVIESACAQGEHKTHDILRRKYDWEGRYVTINTGKPVEEYTDQPLFQADGDGMDPELLGKIVDTAAASRPVYAVNMAIGIMLSYFPERMGYESRRGDEAEICVPLLEARTDLWSRNMARSSLEVLFMSDYVADDSNHIECQGTWRPVPNGLYGGLGGLNRSLMRLFSDRMVEFGWTVSEVEINNWPGPYTESFFTFTR